MSHLIYVPLNVTLLNVSHMKATNSIFSPWPKLQVELRVMEDIWRHNFGLIISITFILSLHWDGVLSYPSSDRALDTRSYMAGPGALPQNMVPATSSCCILASVSLSWPQTAMRAFVSEGVHDIPRQAVKLLEEDEAAVRTAVPEPSFKGEKRLGVDGLEWYWLLSLKSSDSGDGTSDFGIFNGVDISGECSVLPDAAMLTLLLRGEEGKVTCWPGLNARRRGGYTARTVE